LQERKWQCNGILILLDVLGWRDRETVFIEKWQKVTDLSIAEIGEILKNNAVFKGISCSTGVFETDSYIIAAWRDNKEIDVNLVAFASICTNAMISACWREGLLLRGCLSIGEFTATNDLKVNGAAIVDARSEFNAMNWVGCHATIKAAKILDSLIPKYKVLRNTFVGVIDPPYKDKSLSGQRWVLNWAYAFFQQPQERELREIMKNELSKAKKETDIAKHKFTNRFFEKVYAELVKREERRKASKS
jgi:hypothetical protein